jgi:hypothetical protein
VIWQYVSGAYRSELASHPDEAAHYITGLMMRDYAAALFPSSPIRFAEEYYLHYPKVAIGHWPPLFYIVQGIWMLVFSPSRISILLLMALITVATAASLQTVVEPAFGVIAGALAAVVFVCLPVVQKHSCMVMADMLVALLCFRAATAFGRYLDSQRWLDAAGFGAYASLAIMAKGNGLALALLPPIAIALARRPDTFKRASLWASAAMVAIVCGPWQLFTVNMVRNGWVRSPGLDYTLDSITRYSSLLVGTAGIGMVGVAAIGAVTTLRDPFKAHKEPKGIWASMTALFLSVAVFNFVVPATIESRLLIPLLAPLVLLAIAGVGWLSRKIAFVIPGPLFARTGLIVCLLTLIFVRTTFALSRKHNVGFDQVAEAVLSNPLLKNAIILVSSETNGEGAFIAEMAMREKRLGHIILRGSKVLAHSSWDGRSYECVYRTSTEVDRYMTELPVRVLVVDTSSGAPLDHHRNLMNMISEHPEDWVLVDSYPRESAADAKVIRVYRLIGHDHPPGKVRIDLNLMINRVIER